MQEETQSAEPVPEIRDEAVVSTDTQSMLESLAAERDQLSREKTELQDLLLRRAAEFDNYRKRTERERAEMIEYAAAEAVHSMLPVLDDLERALKQPAGDADYARGVELIYQRMFESLKKLGLEPLEAAGKPFDPNLHHAIEMVETDELEDHTVIEEWQKGYTFKGRLLRPSMVRVAVRK